MPAYNSPRPAVSPSRCPGPGRVPRSGTSRPCGAAPRPRVPPAGPGCIHGLDDMAVAENVPLCLKNALQADNLRQHIGAAVDIASWRLPQQPCRCHGLHYANHEKSFLQSASRKIFRVPFKHRIVDTSFLYRIAEPGIPIVRLDEFCAYNDIPIVDRHHALGDAKLTARLWSIYIQKVQELGCETLHEVYERLARL